MAASGGPRLAASVGPAGEVEDGVCGAPAWVEGTACVVNVFLRLSNPLRPDPDDISFCISSDSEHSVGILSPFAPR